MYRIEEEGYGFKLTFGGAVDVTEIKAWLNESKHTLVGSPDEFCVYVDMRTLKPMHDDAQSLMKEGQKLYRLCGMLRSVVVVNNIITAMQFKRIALETNIGEFERYIDPSTSYNWEQVAIDWIVRGIDPDTLDMAINEVHCSV